MFKISLWPPVGGKTVPGAEWQPGDKLESWSAGLLMDGMARAGSGGVGLRTDLRGKAHWSLLPFTLHSPSDQAAAVPPLENGLWRKEAPTLPVSSCRGEPRGTRGGVGSKAWLAPSLGLS